MAERFLDTNILLRHLLDDHPEQSPAARELIRAIEAGQTTVRTTDLVIAELVWVLSNRSTYNLSREDTRDLLLPLIELPGIKLPGKRRYRRIFDLFAGSRLSFIDCYHAIDVADHSPAELYSYDQGFDRVPGIRRIEPPMVSDA